MAVNHFRYRQGDTLFHMGSGASKNLSAVLWENVRALMVRHWGAENLNRLARQAKIGPGSAARIKEARTAVRINTLEKIARTFGVEPWMLLAPGLSDEKFLEILKAWQHTDGRGKRMLLSAAEGAIADDGERPERPAAPARLAR